MHRDYVLTLNAGSSSVKFALFAAMAGWPERVAAGEVDGLGAAPNFHARIDGGAQERRALVAEDHDAAVRDIFDWAAQRFPNIRLGAIGHRIVHGGLAYGAPVALDDAIMRDLWELAPLAPLHQPHNLKGVEAARAAFPGAPQIACFDTSFHRGHAFAQDAYALPRSYYERGLRRFGFHGLSYEYIARRMREIAPVVACGRMIVAHLGNGDSLCAMKDGRSVATTMGFSALEGMPMGTRCGAIDPGLLLYLLQHDGMSAEALTHLLYEQSGLKGLSGVSQDMRVLEASSDPAAAEAIDYFIARLRMEIGAMAAALAGVDAIVFTGGIGEHSAAVRAAATRDMGWLGAELDAGANARGELELSTAASRAKIFALPTNEEAMIAEHTIDVAGLARLTTA
jgi:acetate kinase